MLDEGHDDRGLEWRGREPVVSSDVVFGFDGDDASEHAELQREEVAQSVSDQ